MPKTYGEMSEQDKERARGRQRKWYARNRAGQRNRCKHYRETTLDARHAYDKEYRTKNRETILKRGRNNHYKSKYGITLDQRDAMLVAQGNACKTCGSKDPGNKRGWQVDHCHATGKVRGVLCHPCNTGIGLARENIETLRNWISYLRK